ncbi:hypothetical protein WJX84_010800 [Apatococcus fuscideae]|uniref:IPT/TIG domain-containing protein n=1 Tax=Apatococcus fuscideae TaxID=2026836 RepID=A0AAW1SKY5_9CHLO
MPSLGDAAGGQLVEQTREYRWQPAAMLRSAPQPGKAKGPQQLQMHPPGMMAAEAAVPSAELPAIRESASSGSRDGEPRSQRRFVSPFALAATHISLGDDSDSDGRTASTLGQERAPSGGVSQVSAAVVQMATGLDMSSRRSGNMVHSSDEVQPAAERTHQSGNSSAGSQQDNSGGPDPDIRGQGSSDGTAPQLSVADYAPEWDYTTGGTKLLISGDFEHSAHEHLCVLLDGIKISAQVSRPGTIKCIVPPHKEGTVRMVVSTESGSALSKPLSFTYRSKQQLPSPQQAPLSVLREMPAEEMQLRLIHLLMGARSGASTTPEPAAGVSQMNDGMSRATSARSALLKAFTSNQKNELLQALQREAVQKFADQASGLQPNRSGSLAVQPSPSTVASVTSLCAGLGYDWALRLLQPAASNQHAAVKDDWGCTPQQWATARAQADCMATLATLHPTSAGCEERATDAVQAGVPPEAGPATPTRMQRKRSRQLVEAQIAAGLLTGTHAAVSSQVSTETGHTAMTAGQYAIMREQQEIRAADLGQRLKWLLQSNDRSSAHGTSLLLPKLQPAAAALTQAQTLCGQNAFHQHRRSADGSLSQVPGGPASKRRSLDLDLHLPDVPLYPQP